jgi:hypothetical protein
MDSIATPDAVDKLLQLTRSIYIANETETPQMIVKAYENGSYTKVRSVGNRQISKLQPFSVTSDHRVQTVHVPS